MDNGAIIKYFKLNEHPFMTSPDPRFLYFSSQVREALAKCEFMARDRIGPIYMYGPIGSGKTSLVRRLQEKLSQDERYIVKLLISPNLKSSNAFLRLILETFDVKTERSYTASLSNFENFLVDQFKQNKIPVLLIDEAQYMNRDTLKLIHYLLNFETNKTKLLQVVLVGQEELGTKIIHYKELVSRMFPVAMNSMSPDDLKDMINFRLRSAKASAIMATADEEIHRIDFRQQLVELLRPDDEGFDDPPGPGLVKVFGPVGCWVYRVDAGKEEKFRRWIADRFRLDELGEMEVAGEFPMLRVMLVSED